MIQEGDFEGGLEVIQIDVSYKEKFMTVFSKGGTIAQHFAFKKNPSEKSHNSGFLCIIV